jgi:hypothetical protein
MRARDVRRLVAPVGELGADGVQVYAARLLLARQRQDDAAAGSFAGPVDGVGVVEFDAKCV